MAQKKSDQVRRVGHGSSFGFTPLKKLPNFSEIYRSDDPREMRQNQIMDEAMEEWRRAFQRGASSEGAVIVLNRGNQGGSGGIGLAGAQGAQGAQGAMGFQGAGASGILVHVWIAYRTDGIAGTGLQHDPYDGSSQPKFDTLMRSFGPNTFIHIGPGTFLTNGNITGPLALADQWHVRTGWKIYGSGMDSTIIKLINAAEDDSNYFIIFSDVIADGFADDIDIADLTLDCNLDGQPGAVTAGGLVITGSRNKVQRVRVINWGAKTTISIEPFAFGGGNTSPEFGDINGFLVDGVFIGRPTAIEAPGNVGTMMSFGGVATQLIWSAISITSVGDIATLDLGAITHSLSLGKWFKIRNATQAQYNGSFQVSEIVNDFSVRFAITGSPASPATGTPELEHPNNSHGLGLGMLRGLVVRNCMLDGEDFDDATANTHGLSVAGVDGAILENNTIRNVSHGIYMDSWRGISAVIKGNIIQKVNIGIYFNLANDIWGFDTLVIESNLIEVNPIPFATSTGITAGNTRTERPLGFRSVIIRNNILRFVDGLSSPTFDGVAITVKSIESLVVTGNLIGFSAAEQIRTFAPVLNVFAQNNRTEDGKIVLSFDWGSMRPWFDPDIESDKILKTALIGA